MRLSEHRRVLSYHFVLVSRCVMRFYHIHNFTDTAVGHISDNRVLNGGTSVSYL